MGDDEKMAQEVAVVLTDAERVQRRRQAQFRFLATRVQSIQGKLGIESAELASMLISMAAQHTFLAGASLAEGVQSFIEHYENRRDRGKNQPRVALPDPVIIGPSGGPAQG